MNNAADVFTNVVRSANVDLAGRQENIDADIHQQATLDFSGAGSCDDLAFLDRLHHFLPSNDLLCLAFAKADHAVRIFCRAGGVFDLFDQDFDRGPYIWLFFFFFPFGKWNGAFAFETDVDQHAVIVNSDHPTVDNAVHINVRFGLNGAETRLFSSQQSGINCADKLLITLKTTN